MWEIEFVRVCVCVCVFSYRKKAQKWIIGPHWVSAFSNLALPRTNSTKAQSLGSISPTFYVQVWHVQIQKVQKKTVNSNSFFGILGSAGIIKAVRKLVDEISSGSGLVLYYIRSNRLLCSKRWANHCWVTDCIECYYCAAIKCKSGCVKCVGKWACQLCRWVGGTIVADLEIGREREWWWFLVNKFVKVRDRVFGGNFFLIAQQRIDILYTHKHTHLHTDRHTNTHFYTNTNTHTHTHIYTQTDKQIHTHTHTCSYTERQTDRQTDRKTHIHTHTYTHTQTCNTCNCTCTYTHMHTNFKTNTLMHLFKHFF